jgi:hypothetical protein
MDGLKNRINNVLTQPNKKQISKKNTYDLNNESQVL